MTDDYEKAKERELKGPSAAMEETGLKSGYIVTSSEEEAIAINGLTITVIPLWKFVLSIFFNRLLLFPLFIGILTIWTEISRL